ncbi:hypothetical protein LJC42_06945 [Eubacteriales bacterium OttesenSCG-928-K08]|nr:hypothetical protein [Eubacteriales bacterium OttesenSCG-928-K08]
MSYSKRQADLHNAQTEHTQKNVRVAAIVKVLSFDPDTMTVEVQPLNMKKIDGESASASPLVAVPVAMLCCGEFSIRPWYKRGDVGMVVYADEDNDAALEGGGAEVEPSTNRNHAPEDAFFIGGIAVAGKAPRGLPSDALVLAAGNVYISVNRSGIQLNGAVDITGELTVNGLAFGTHTHGGVESGTGSTSGPQ